MAKAQFTGIGIHLKVNDIHASRNFYEKLGFTPVFGYGDEDFRATLPNGCPSASEKYRGITYRLADNAELEIAEGHIAVNRSERPEVYQDVVKSPKISGMIRVRSVVPIVEELADAIKFPVRKYYWGSIEVAVRDPDGFVLVFIAPHTDDEMAAVKALVPVEVIEAQA